MPLGLGLAASHGASMFVEPAHWPTIEQALARDVPRPPEALAETDSVIVEYSLRIKQALECLAQRLREYRPDALVIVGDDQTEVFSNAFMPTWAIYVGEEVTGSTSIRLIGQNLADNHIHLRSHAPLARAILGGLMERGFDPAFIEKLQPLSQPTGGLGHAFTRLPKAFGVPELDIPVVIVFINSYVPPMPSAARCLEFGRALRAILEERPERVALLGSGGLSHDPRGPRAGWVDEPLDRWVLATIASGQAAKLRTLFTFDSDTLRNGTGEIRSWITVAGAFDGVCADVVDYVPARRAVTGFGFASWTPSNSAS